MTGRRIVYLNLAAALIVLVMLQQCRHRATGRTITDAQIARVERAMHIDSPPSARFLLFQHEEGLDEMIRVVIEIPADDVGLLWTRLPMHDPAFEWEDGRHGLLPPGHGRWRPDVAVRSRSAQVELRTGAFLSVMIDDSDPGTNLVYLTLLDQ